jgi:hypothetical protein
MRPITASPHLAPANFANSQRVDAAALAADAEARGWIMEADRHRRLLARLDALIAEQAG